MSLLTEWREHAYSLDDRTPEGKEFWLDYFQREKAIYEKILENLKHLAREGRDMILRIPVIPDVNDDDINMKETADFILNELDGHVRTLQLLSFMRLGEEKYISLGIPYRMEDVELDREEFQKKVEKICAYFNDRNIHCLVGTKEKE